MTNVSIPSPTIGPAIPELQTHLDAIPHTVDRVVQLVDTILHDAETRSVSDVHWEPTPRSLDVRYRRDGVIQTVARLPRELAPNLIARLKVLAELLTYRQDVPQEGSIRRRGNDSTNDRRVSTVPTVHGEKAVVRLFDSSPRLLDLEQLGLSVEILAAIERLLNERDGAFFLTGPSGSGKTTTIYSCLRRIVATNPGRQLVTIEDPVEQLLEGVTQSQVRPGTEFDFARGLRSLLRQDPDGIMIGEVRDPETAAVGIQAALTGHLVFSTLHAGSACGVVGRLSDMGIEPYLLTSGLRGILNQRLLRELCPQCKRSTHLGCVAIGCDACGGTGYRGRFLIAELLIPNAEFRRAVLAKADTEELESVVARNGWRTIRDAARDAIASGRTTLQEVNRVLGSFAPSPDSLRRMEPLTRDGA